MKQKIVNLQSTYLKHRNKNMKFSVVLTRLYDCIPIQSSPQCLINVERLS